MIDIDMEEEPMDQQSQSQSQSHAAATVGSERSGIISSSSSSATGSHQPSVLDARRRSQEEQTPPKQDPESSEADLEATLKNLDAKLAEFGGSMKPVSAFVAEDLPPRPSAPQPPPDVVGMIDQGAWVIATLWRFHIRGEVRPGRVGVWVDQGGGKEAKIAAIGIRLRRWVSFHGLAINLNPSLDDYEGIVPCGIREHGVTSFEDLGLTTTMAELDGELRHCFAQVFGASDGTG